MGADDLTEPAYAAVPRIHGADTIRVKIGDSAVQTVLNNASGFSALYPTYPLI